MSVTSWSTVQRNNADTRQPKQPDCPFGTRRVRGRWRAAEWESRLSVTTSGRNVPRTHPGDPEETPDNSTHRQPHYRKTET